eukprot:2752367-Ditylum_brightwellii.AAC.1
MTTADAPKACATRAFCAKVYLPRITIIALLALFSPTDSEQLPLDMVFPPMPNPTGGGAPNDACEQSDEYYITTTLLSNDRPTTNTTPVGNMAVLFDL